MERTSFQRGNVAPTIFYWPDDVLLPWFIVTRDEGILGEFVKRHKQMGLDVCQRVFHHRQDAKDATQETFFALWRIRP